MKSAGSNGVPATEVGPRDDPRVVQALEEYLDALEAGRHLDRRALLARYADVAAALAECLDGLEFVHSVAPHLHPTPAAPLPDVLPQDTVLGDYRLLRQIGRGGMGVVYEAAQTSLGRRVALKVLPFVAALDPRQLQRFRHEAQAAAQLHHPHIVPVFAVGCERGVHYYAMQLIDGRNLDQILKSQPPPGSAPATRDGGDKETGREEDEECSALSVSSSPCSPISLTAKMVAQLGVQAAEALEYAHQVGVVHRDIKPANLLLDGQGNLWITDFGLARFQSQTELTRTGDLLGTLCYMSPEQASARHGLVDHRTDVYALGATLYELLTRRPVFDSRDRLELLCQIVHVEPQPLRHWDRTIPVALETIVLKALAKDPAARYATAQELAEDLNRFLADQPIRAQRPTWRERLTRWTWRRRRWVAAAFGVLLAGVLVLAVSSVLIYRQRQEARQRRQQAIAAYDRMYTRVAQDWLSRQPHLEPLQREFLLDVLHFYEELLREDGDDPQLREETARAACRVGDIQHRLGVLDEAETAYQRAIVLFERLTADCPDRADYRRELAVCRNNHGNLLRERSQLGAALQEYDQSRALFDQALAGQPDDAELLDGLAGAEANRALVLPALGQPRAAESAYRRALELLEKLVAAQPQNLAYRHDLALVRNNFGYLLYQNGRRGEARAFYQQALEQRERLVAEAPGLPLFREDLAQSAHNLGQLLRELGQAQESQKLLERALALRSQLLADFPSVPVYRQELAATQHALGILAVEAGQLREAEAFLRQAVDLRRQLVEAQPSLPVPRQELADSYYELGLLCQNVGRPEEALKAFRAALVLQEQLAAAAPGDAVLCLELAAAQLQLSQFLRLLGRPEEAEPALRRSLALTELLPAQPKARLLRARGHDGLAQALHAAAHPAEAEKAFRQAVAVYEQLAVEPSSPPEARLELAQTWSHFGEFFRETGRPEEALAAYRQALAVWEQMPADIAGRPRARQEFAWFLLTCPQVELRDPARALALARQAVVQSPRDGAAWHTLALAQLRCGDARAARVALEQALPLRYGGNSYDWFLLAMALRREGHEEQAARWQERAATWMKTNRPADAELGRLEEEARSGRIP